MDRPGHFVEWFKFFIASIPPVQPVLVIEDGHLSHMSMEVIELARANDIHLLCLPAHCIHILQPLDITSLKSHFNKACRDFLAATPRRVILPENLSALLAEAWPKAVNPMNIFSGFRKSGIFPSNPGEVTDRYTAPAKVYEESSVPDNLDGVSVDQSNRTTDDNADSLTERLNDVLVLPKVKSSRSTNSSARCITDDSFIEEVHREA